MRNEGRLEDSLRKLSIETGALKWAEGSALISLGNTRVLCAATVQNTVPDWMKGKGRGWVTAEYSMLPRSTSVRTVRESTRGRPDGRVQEIQRLVGRSLRAVCDMPALGEKTVIVDCDVLQADGGTRTASITGAWVALALAQKWLAGRDASARPFLREAVAAVSVGMSEGRFLLDMEFAEDSRADVDLNAVMTASGRLVEIQGTAESAPFTEKELGEMLALARKGISALLEEQQKALGRAGSPP
jgi:ribonuclease PH